jgi:hypothetical protein
LRGRALFFRGGRFKHVVNGDVLILDQAAADFFHRHHGGLLRRSLPHTGSDRLGLVGIILIVLRILVNREPFQVGRRNHRSAVDHHSGIPFGSRSNSHSDDIT